MKLYTALLVPLALAGVALAARATLQESMPDVKPGPEHALMKQMAGTWDGEIDTGAPQKDKGQETRTLGMNGLWLVSDFQGSFQGAPFLGHDVMGWDAGKKKYVSCWVDSSGMQLTLSEGTWDEKTKTLTMTSLAPDPMTGQVMVNLTKIVDADHHVWEMHPGSADAPALMTIHYTRKK